MFWEEFFIRNECERGSEPLLSMFPLFNDMRKLDHSNCIQKHWTSQKQLKWTVYFQTLNISLLLRWFTCTEADIRELYRRIGSKSKRVGIFLLIGYFKNRICINSIFSVLRPKDVFCLWNKSVFDGRTVSNHEQRIPLGAGEHIVVYICFLSGELMRPGGLWPSGKLLIYLLLACLI